MTDEEKELRERTAAFAREHVGRGDATAWFEELYKQADGNTDLIPWADLEPNRFFVEWDKTARIKGEGRKALVVGCGLGDEAAYLAERGFDVTAFDISEKAVEWAGRIHKGSGIRFVVADLFTPPAEWKKAFDFVIEVYTIQALPRTMREKTIDAIAGLVTDGGELVVVQWLGDGLEEDDEGPPWPVSRAELRRFEEQGLTLAEFETHIGDEEEPVERFVARFQQKLKLDN